MLMNCEWLEGQPTSDVPAGILPLPSTPCPLDVAGNLGAGLVMLGETAVAAPLLEQVHVAGEATALHLWAIAQIDRGAGRLDAARDALRACCASSGADPRWFGDLGAVLCALGEDWREAERAFDIALVERGPLQEYLFGRAWARAEQGNREGALSDLEACLQLRPDATEAWLLLADLALRYKSASDLERALKALGELAPAEAQRLRELGMQTGVLSR